MKNNLWQRITSVFWPRNQADWPEEDARNPHRINGGVNGSTALRFSGCWCATNTIAGIFGALPAKVYRKTPEGREEATDHSTYRILSREPNPEMDSFVFWEMLTQWWVNYGNAFAEIQRRENSKQIVALYPIHPSRMKREKVNGEYTGRWIVRNDNGDDSFLEADEVFNIVGALSDDGVIGKGVLTYASATIATALAEQGYRADFYANGGRPSGVLKHPSKLSPEARDNLRSEWKTVHGRGNEIAILWEGMEFTPTSVSPEHSEIIKSSVFSIQEMARFYDLPPHVLYELSHGTFANVEEMNRFLVSHSLNRRMVRVEKACDRQLFSEAEKRAGYFVKFNVNALLRGNPKEQAEINQIKLQNGVINQDEWRAQDDHNIVAGGLGKQYWMRRDMAPTELVIESAKKSVEETTPIIPTAPTPDTPPALGNAWKEAATSYRYRWKNEVSTSKALEQSLADVTHERDEREGLLQAKIAALESGAEASERTREKLYSEACDLMEERDAHKGRADTAEGKVSALEAALIDREQRIETATAALATVTQDRDDYKAAAEAEASAGDEARAEIAKLNASAEQDAAAYLEACEQRDSLQSRLDNATESLSEVQRTVETLQEAEKETHLRHVEAISAANRSLQESQAKATALSLDVGTLRAECDGLKQQRDVTDAERRRAASEVIELRSELQKAGELTAKAKQDAETATNDAQTLIAGTKETVSASIRALLDASLDSLLWKERSRIKDCAKNYDRFKELTSEFYLTFTNELAANLANAAQACEAVGFPRVDAAKLAADYVTESRKRLNIAFNGANKAEIRPAINHEVEGWDRKNELTRIGE